MKKFDGFDIPEGVHFNKFVSEDVLVSDDHWSCRMVTDLELLTSDFRDTRKDPRCNLTTCYKCIFFEDNAKSRLKYWKSLQKQQRSN